MLRVKSVGQRGTVLIVVGAARIEWGVLSQGQWMHDSIQSLDIAPEETESSHLSALMMRAEMMLSNWLNTKAKDDDFLIGEVRATVADCWLAQVEVPWGAMMTKSSSAQRFVRDNLSVAGFVIGMDDILRVGDGRFGAPRLAVAYPADLMAMLMHLAKQLNASLSSVLPLSVQVWRQTQSSAHLGTRVMAVQDETLLLFVRGNTELTDVKVKPSNVWGSGDSIAAVCEQWQRMQLRDIELSTVNSLWVLSLMDGSSPHWIQGLVAISLPEQTTGLRVSSRLHLAHLAMKQTSVLDACEPHPKLSVLGRVAFCLMLIITITLIMYASYVAKQSNELLREVAVSRPVIRPVSQSLLWSTDELHRVSATNAAIRQLNLPITDLFQTLAAPQDIATAVLKIEVIAGDGGQRTAVKITAEAATAKDMARYVESVAKRKPFTETYLTQHEVLSSIPSRPYRFSMEAVWSK